MTGRSCHHHGPCQNMSRMVVGMSDGPGMQTHDCCGDHPHLLYGEGGIASTVGPEKWYVVCETCGEAFDEIGYAKAHELSCDTNTSYEVKPESEAL